MAESGDGDGTPSPAVVARFYSTEDMEWPEEDGRSSAPPTEYGLSYEPGDPDAEGMPWAHWLMPSEHELPSPCHPGRHLLHKLLLREPRAASRPHRARCCAEHDRR